MHHNYNHVLKSISIDYLNFITEKQKTVSNFLARFLINSLIIFPHFYIILKLNLRFL